MEKTDRWKVLPVRKFMDRFLKVVFSVMKVWRIDNDVSEPLPVLLLIRKELDESEIKYSLCNAIHFNSWDRLVRMQSQSIREIPDPIF